MASEPKRQNAGNKAPVALPNSGPSAPSPTVSLDAALSGVLGARIRVTTSPPSSSTFEGLLYTADPITSLIVLSVPSSSSQTTAAAPTSARSTTSSNTFKILPISQLNSVAILQLPATNTPQQLTTTNPNLPQPISLSLPLLTSRLNSTITNLKQQDARRGRNVTHEAQDIFDGIARTHPARWMGTSMLVNENIVIDSPYGVDDCRLLNTAGAGAEQGLLRIKKVLGMEREKLALRRGLGTAGLGLGLSVGAGMAAKGSKRAGAGVVVGERKGG